MPHIIPSLTKLIPMKPHVITLRAKVTLSLAKVTPTLLMHPKEKPPAKLTFC